MFFLCLKATIVFVFAVLALFTVASAFQVLVPDGKELIYEYKAYVKAATHIPASFSSDFILKGKLHVQREANNVLARLTDVTYMMHNGRSDMDESMLKEVAVGQELGDLLKVFKIGYDETGKVTGIATEDGEKEYSRNIKRAIASIMQMDVKKVALNSVKSHAFVDEELSIYGKIKTFYDVLPRGEVLIVQKMHELMNTRCLYKHMATNLFPDYCEARYEDPLSYDSQREYEIVKRDGQQVIRRMESNGGTYLHIFQAQSDAFYIYVNQTWNLLQITAAQPLKLTKEHHETDLSYYLGDVHAQTGAIPDLTNGRRTIDMQKLISEVQTMMQEILDYMIENHLHTKQPNIEHGQLINRIERAMMHLDMPSLETIYNALVAKTDENGKNQLAVMHQLLPLIGSRASMMMIKNLIEQKKVKPQVAIEMLQQMPLNVKAPTMKLLTEMEPMMKWNEDIIWSIRKTAILAFSTLIFKTKMSENLSHRGEDHAEGNVQEKFEPFVMEFINRLKASQKYDQQMLYLEALFNTRLESVLKHLEPAVKGEWWDNRHLRALSMWAVYPSAAANPDKMYELFWPILADNTLHTELRVIAYYIIMESRPTLARMINISWLMNSEKNHELYQFYYRYLQAMSRTTEPCRAHFKLNIKQILKYTHTPNMYGLTGYYQMDYQDIQYKFGGVLRGMVIQSDKQLVMNYGLSYQVMNMVVNHFTIVVKITGLKGLDLLKMTTTGNKMFSFDDLMATTLGKSPEVHLEIVLLKQDQIYASCYYDGTNIEELHQMLGAYSHYKTTNQKKHLKMEFHMYNKVMIPNDMGFTVTRDIMMPVVQYSEVNFVKSVVNHIDNVHLETRETLWANSRYGLSMYNPIVDVWQGVGRYRTFDVVLPLNIDFSFNQPQQTLKIAFKRHPAGKETKDYIGFRSHVTTLVFVKDDLHHDVLAKSCPKAQEFVIVSKGDAFRHEVIEQYFFEFIFVPFNIHLLSKWSKEARCLVA